MASAVRSMRALSRLHSRAFTSSARRNAAQNFTMPAMSPTMTEGNIGSWKVKEGDSYSAGDVLLEIETDKAQMDVEAQEDGMLFKITVGDGSRGVKVGARIAVIAEAGDDLSSLSMPKEDSASSAREEEPASKQAASSKQDHSKPESRTEEPSEPSQSKQPSEPASKSHSKPSSPQKYPLYPSVQFALKQHGLSASDADSIPATGPNGRLLKGDVLSHVGAIDKSYSSQQSARVAKLAHLDLSNIKLAEPSPKPTTPKKDEAQQEEQQQRDTEIALPISLAAVLATQARVRSALGIDLPLSVFVGRASALANESLPAGRAAPPTADELFDAVLGASPATPARVTRGHYTAAMTVLAPPLSDAPVEPGPRVRSGGDVFDELVGVKAAPRGRSAAPRPVPTRGPQEAVNVFSVTARSGEEARARAYLARMKLVLEKEPGRLVL